MKKQEEMDKSRREIEGRMVKHEFIRTHWPFLSIQSQTFRKVDVYSTAKFSNTIMIMDNNRI